MLKWCKRSKSHVSPFFQKVNEQLLLGHIDQLNNEIGKLYSENQQLRKDMAELEYRYCMLKAGLLKGE